MTITAGTIRDMIASGISRFQKPFDIAANRIQLVFYIDEQQTVTYLVCIDGIPKNTVQLKDIIGVNIYNLMVASHIKKLITRLAEDTGREQTKVNLFCDLDEKGVARIWLREDKISIREVTNDELIK